MTKNRTYTLQELSTLTGAELKGDPHHRIRGVASLDSADSSEASFLANPLYKESLNHSKAGLICIPKTMTPPADRNSLLCDDPSRTFQTLVELFTPETASGFVSIHPSAIIHPSARIGKEVQIGPYAVIDQNVEIGEHCRIGAHVSIGPGVQIGSHVDIHPHVVIRELCKIGNRVILQPGAVIGSCGFGYTTDNKGEHHKLKQLGIVVIEDDVEIGANSTIDRARFDETRIGRGTKIDNLVQIGHNVRLGEHNIIVSQSGIAGSSTTGRNVVIGGQAGIVGHVDIADFVMIATRGGVSKSIDKAGKYAGGPTMPLAEYNRWQVQLRKIDEYIERIKEIEHKINKQ